MKKIGIFLLSLSVFSLISCTGIEDSSTSSNIDSTSSITSSSQVEDSSSSTSSDEEEIINSVTEDEFGGGQYDDYEGEDDDITPLIETITALRSVTKYTYETTYSISGVTEKVIDHYGEHYFYEENLSDPSQSFGYAEEAYTTSSRNVLKFYVNDGDDISRYEPSIYLYEGTSSGNPVAMQEVFGATGVAGLHNIYDAAMEELTAIRVTEVSYLLTSSSLYTVFQFMTQLGSSIADSMTQIKLDILDRNTNKIQVTISLGDTGDITSILTPVETSEFDDLDEALESGEIKGYAYHDEVVTLFEENLNLNNYTIHPSLDGIDGSFTAYLANDYFLIDFADEYNQSGYLDFGYAYLPSGTEVTLETTDENGNYVESETISVHYSACYEFDYVDGEVHFLNLVGPNETDDMKIFEVENYDDLYEISEENLNEDYLYVVVEENYAYVYGIIDGSTNEYGFTSYSEWFDTVGDFYISNSSTFYTSSAAIGSLARFYMEKESDNEFYSTDSSFVYQMANSLFGWGFIDGTSWLSYCEKAYASFEEDEGVISSAKLGLSIRLPNGSRNIEACMDITDIGTTRVTNIENKLDQLQEGE